jgi:hypothetical protein
MHDGYLGNVPPGRLQVYFVVGGAMSATFGKDFCPREKMFKA